VKHGVPLDHVSKNARSQKRDRHGAALCKMDQRAICSAKKGFEERLDPGRSTVTRAKSGPRHIQIRKMTEANESSTLCSASRTARPSLLLLMVPRMSSVTDVTARVVQNIYKHSVEDSRINTQLPKLREEEHSVRLNLLGVICADE